MQRKGLLLALGLACGAGLLGSWLSDASRAAEAPEIRLLTREVSLGKPGPGMIVDLRKVVVSLDSRHLAYVVGRGQKGVRGPDNMPFVGPPLKVVVDGVEGKVYEIFSDLVFSPDGRRVAYGALGVGGRWLAVVDGVEWRREDGWVTDPTFSPDSRRLAYMAGRGGKEFWVVDGVEGKEGVVRDLVFSPDSRRVAYDALGVGGKWLVVVDGVEGKAYLDTTGGGPGARMLPVFSPDSKRLAFAACAQEPSGDPIRPNFKSFVVVDGVEGKGYSSIMGGPVFSPDSKRLAFAAFALEPSGDPIRPSFKSFVIVDGVEGKGYSSTRGGPVFSPDSKRLAYAACALEPSGDPIRPSVKCSVVVDGVEGKGYDQISDLVFSPDSRHVAYLADRGGRWFAVVDGAEGKEYEGFVPRSRLIFDSPNQLHALAVRGGEFLRVEMEIVTAGAGTGAPH